MRRKSTEYDDDQVRAGIQRKIDGLGCMPGYRSMWHMLRREGFMVPRSDVANMLRELDPAGNEERKTHGLYPGPNFCWHMDGYDKHKPFGFPIHDCIDGFSHKMLWLKLSRSNSNPE